MTFKLRRKEIIIDILIRLPTKSLVRFLCVCKPWNDLIGSSSFVSTHLNRNVTKDDHTYLLCLHNPNFERLEDPDDPCVGEERQWSLFSSETFDQSSKLSHPLGSTEHYGIYGSSNGLVCISDEILIFDSPIHIWNPSVRKVRTLPKSSNKTKFGYISLQFCFHPGINDYKVIRMTRNNKGAFSVEVYSLRTDSWKVIETIPDWLKGNWQHCRGTTFDGVAYNIIEKGRILSIMSFNSGSEEFEEFIAPDASLKPQDLCIDVYKEQVCLLIRFYDCEEEDMDKFELWVLQDKQWKELSPFIFLVDDSEVTGAIGISIDDELLLERRDYQKGVAELCLCNYGSKQVIQTGIKLAVMTYAKIKFLRSMVYIASLVLLGTH